jgi:hypothetical protein
MTLLTMPPLQLATAALAASGYRAERQNKHQRTIECLAFTLKLTPEAVIFLDACWRKRHVAVYDQIGAVSEKEAADILAAAQSLRRTTKEWLKRTHSTLFS